jgi:hypothetical protein
MSDFAAAWELSRARFVQALDGLSDAQLNWRLHPGTLTLAESAMHVAGVEVSFAAQLLELKLDGELARLRMAATDGVVNDLPFPYAADEMTAPKVATALETAREVVEPVIRAPGEAVLARQILSALGPVIDGRGALARLAFHAGYHQGQAHLIKTAPGFPPKGLPIA